MKKILLNLIERLGYTVIKKSQQNALFSDITNKEFWEIYSFCKPYTRTSIERMHTLYNAVEYILVNNIKGDFVECGVWRGGSAMMIAKMLANRNIEDRKIYLYDTFEGMSEPTSDDITITGEQASKLLDETVTNKKETVWCLADIIDVQNNMKATGYNERNLIFVQGKVEDTIPGNVPESIALLRLDTDWYESTKHELIYLFPKIPLNGLLIIDDYGHWQGCKKAVDEYINENKLCIFLSRIDYTGRIAVKTS